MCGKPLIEIIFERGANDESEGIQGHKSCTSGDTGKRAEKPLKRDHIPKEVLMMKVRGSKITKVAQGILVRERGSR